MAQRFRITQYDIVDAGAGNIAILVKGSERYYNILTNTLSKNLRFSRIWPDRNHKFDWGTYAYNVSDKYITRVKNLLDLLCDTLYLHDALDQTFALDNHGKPYYEGGGRTEIGEMVFQAKPYKSQATGKHRQNAIKLADQYKRFIKCHPCYENPDYIIAVPYFGEKDFDLSTLISSYLSNQLEIIDANGFVRKTRKTKPMKDLETLEEKMENIYGAFEVNSSADLDGKLVIAIDDLYRSGVTLHEFGTTLKRAGAIVRGLVATKTFRD